MTVHELRNADDARRYLLQGLCLQRVRAPSASTMEAILHWALEVAAEGDPLPPIGFVADVGHLMFSDGAAGHPLARHPAVLGFSATQLRAYEDYVLGKLYVDSSFERAADAVRHYQGRDRARGLRFMLDQFRQRAGFGGVALNPAFIKSLQRSSPDDVLSESWQSLAEEGPMPLLVELYHDLISAVRNTGDVLGIEDIFELEHRTAVAEFSQRVALRQLLRAAADLEKTLPPRPSRIKARRHEIPTRILDEDSYPVGGFTSISNRGSVESLLHSQLAYMENETAERPDLFDIKFLRDELLYYSRDENQFLRRRHSFVFALDPVLAEARTKDAGLPWQRMILLLAVLLASVRRTIQWLSQESLQFQFAFLQRDDAPALDDEEELVRIVLREQIANGSVTVSRDPRRALEPLCARLARRSTCHCVFASTRERPLTVEGVLVTRLCLSRAEPRISLGDEPFESTPGETPLDAWRATLDLLLRDFVTT